MTFEEIVRDRIKKSSYPSAERDVLKVVLGDLQLKSSGGKITDEIGHGIVKKLIQSNNENLQHLTASDLRHAKYVEENEVLSSLLPQYWSKDQIRENLVAAGIDVKSMGEGPATGKAMSHLKSINAPIEGLMVKEVVQEMRKS